LAICFFICSATHRDLHSFPTRRSSDLLLSRYRNWMIARLGPFQADLVHITGPGDMGVLGFWVAHCLGIPLVASWHTNLHEYAGRDRKSTRLNSSHLVISYAVFCLKKKN